MLQLFYQVGVTQPFNNRLGMFRRTPAQLDKPLLSANVIQHPPCCLTLQGRYSSNGLWDGKAASSIQSTDALPSIPGAEPESCFQVWDTPPLSSPNAFEDVDDKIVFSSTDVPPLANSSSVPIGSSPVRSSHISDNRATACDGGYWQLMLRVYLNIIPTYPSVFTVSCLKTGS